MNNIEQLQKRFRQKIAVKMGAQMIFSIRNARELRVVVHRATYLFAALIWIALFSLNVGYARSGSVPKSAPAFTQYVARLLQDAMPNAKVSVAGPLTLDVEAPGGGHTTYLHNIYSNCQRNPDQCDEEVIFYVGRMVQVYEEDDTRPTRTALRIVVRPSAYVTAVLHNPKRHKPIAEPLVGDYWILAVADRPASITILDEGDLAQLHLTKKDALALAAANTRKLYSASFPAELAKRSYGSVGGDFYSVSSFAFPDLWAPLAHACKGNLLVSVPSSEVVFYTDGNRPNAVKTITDASDYAVAHAEKPFSDALFRWSPKGWVPADAEHRQN